MFMLHQLVPEVPIPAISTLKKLKLPGFVPPTKVYVIYYDVLFSSIFVQFISSKGIPFFMNLPKTVIQQTFADPTLSNKIARYPVLANNIIRYDSLLYIYYNCIQRNISS